MAKNKGKTKTWTKHEYLAYQCKLLKEKYGQSICIFIEDTTIGKWLSFEKELIGDAEFIEVGNDEIGAIYDQLLEQGNNVLMAKRISSCSSP